MSLFLVSLLWTTATVVPNDQVLPTEHLWMQQLLRLRLGIPMVHPLDMWHCECSETDAFGGTTGTAGGHHW